MTSQRGSGNESASLATGRGAAGGHDAAPSTHEYTVHEAALLLGLSVDAVRKRADRGTLRRKKGADGTVYILLDTDQLAAPRNGDAARRPESTDGPPEDSRTGVAGGDPAADSSSDPSPALPDELVSSLQDQVEYLRREIGSRNEELRVRNEEMRRKDHLLAAALERVPRLEGPKAEAEAEPNADSGDGGETTGAPYVRVHRAASKGEGAGFREGGEGHPPRSWFRRFFFGS